MRIFKIKTDGKFDEFSQTHFQLDHEEAVLENWLENNSNDIYNGPAFSDQKRIAK